MNVPTAFNCICVSTCNTNLNKLICLWFVDSKRPQYYVQVYTGCNHQAFRSILGQNEEWLDPEHFSGFSRVFFRVKDVQWCSTYEIHWKSLEHLRFQHLSTSQGPWCAVQRTERKAEVPPRCDSDMRHETWAGPAFLSCCTMVLWWLELIRRRSECAQLILFQQPGCIWKSSGNHLDALRCRFDPQLRHVVLTAKCTWKVDEGFVGCSSRAASSQRGHRLPQIFREMPMPEKHIVNFCKFYVRFSEMVKYVKYIK